ncbi:hypothetical protein QZH41_016846, partial [Actinostola sp. cb2023]
MASALPNFDPFDIHADGAIAQRWRKWIKRLENLFIAADISDEKRQRALLLYYAGEEVSEVFDTLTDTGEDFETAKAKLNAYFDPKKNVEYEIYMFRQAKQDTGENMNSYHSRLRQLAATCEFTDVDKEVKSQIIQSCSSQRLRRKALKDSRMNLQALLDEARALEISETQAKEIESSGCANAVFPQTHSKPPRKKGTCFNCGESWPHDSNTGCPAQSRKCNSCQRNMATTRSLYRYKRLSLGVNAAAEKFQDVIATAIHDIPNVKNISDDIIIYGVNTEGHDKTLHAVLNRLQELNLTLKKEKCKFYMPRIEFFGMVFSSQGMSPDPAKVDAIKNAESPTSASDVRSLLGMTNYVSRFIRDYADIVAPLRDLTHKGVKFEWEDVHQAALERLKSSLTSDEVMAYFDPSKKSVLLVDSSPIGIGAVFTQDGKFISYASKDLSSVERRYSQIEREAWAIAWGCHHFRMYLLGSHFDVITDHKPLVPIFNSPTSQASVRIDNWRLKLQSFDFKVIYSRGDLNPADYISRHLQGGTRCDLIAKSAEQYVNFVVSQAALKALSSQEIIEATTRDATLQTVMRLISTGQWDDVKKEDGDATALQIFANIRSELTSVDGKLILRGRRIVIPDALQRRVVQLAHEGHQGLVKTRSLLRSKVWFPKMDSLTDSMVKQCVPCQIATPKPSREPINMTPLPSGPWEQVSIDFCEVAGHYVLVIIDDYSRFPEVEIVHSTSAKAAIPKLDRIFAAYGVPQVVKSDNRPPFNGHEFAQFAECIGFKHRKVSPLWPEANGEVERFYENV